jgi:uncharacterized membrane protein
LARWLLGAETAARDLIGAQPGASTTTAALDRTAPPLRDLDRLWAAGAHLAVFGGVWLIAPLVIYLLHRRGSPFVRWHSFQAIVLAIWTICACVIGALVLGLGLLGMLLMENLGLERAADMVMLVSATPIALVLLFSVAMSAIGGIKSLAGKPWTMPVVGRIAAGVIARNSSATSSQGETAELPDGRP